MVAIGRRSITSMQLKVSSIHLLIVSSPTHTLVILLQEGILAIAPTQGIVRNPSTQNVTSLASQAAIRKQDGTSAVLGSEKKESSTTRVDVLPSSTTVGTTTNHYGVHEVNDSASKRLDLSSNESAILAQSSIQDQGLFTVQQEINANITGVEDRSVDFIRETAKARAKARTLVGLSLEEMDIREQQMQLKLERIQAKRKLLELELEE